MRTAKRRLGRGGDLAFLFPFFSLNVVSQLESLLPSGWTRRICCRRRGGKNQAAILEHLGDGHIKLQYANANLDARFTAQPYEAKLLLPTD
jgi:hypothetical protein